MTKTHTELKPNRPYRLPNKTRLEKAIERLRTATVSTVTKYVLEGRVDTDSYDEDTRIRYLALAEWALLLVHSKELNVEVFHIKT